LHPRVAQGVGGPFRGTANVGGVLGQRADAGNREVLLQLVNVAIAVNVDVIDDVVQAVVHGSIIVHASWSPWACPERSRRARPSFCSFTTVAATLSRASGTSDSVIPR